MSLLAGAGVATAAGLALNASYVVQHGALARAAPVRVAAPVASLRGLLSSRRWLAGAALAYGGLGLNAGAMTLAPLRATSPCTRAWSA